MRIVYRLNIYSIRLVKERANHSNPLGFVSTQFVPNESLLNHIIILRLFHERQLRIKKRYMYVMIGVAKSNQRLKSLMLDAFCVCGRALYQLALSLLRHMCDMIYVSASTDVCVCVCTASQPTTQQLRGQFVNVMKLNVRKNWSPPTNKSNYRSWCEVTWYSIANNNNSNGGFSIIYYHKRAECNGKIFPTKIMPQTQQHRKNVHLKHSNFLWRKKNNWMFHDTNLNQLRTF